MLQRLRAQKSNLLKHSGRVTRVVVFGELCFRKLASLGTVSEPSEEEGESRIVEIFLLGSPAVLVHRFADDRKVNNRVLQERVVLVVSMREDE